MNIESNRGDGSKDGAGLTCRFGSTMSAGPSCSPGPRRMSVERRGWWRAGMQIVWGFLKETILLRHCLPRGWEYLLYARCPLERRLRGALPVDSSTSFCFWRQVTSELGFRLFESDSSNCQEQWTNIVTCYCIIFWSLVQSSNILWGLFFSIANRQ